ncbi:alpha/beta hydrolase [Lysobacter xanthus]
MSRPVLRSTLIALATTSLFAAGCQRPATDASAPTSAPTAATPAAPATPATAAAQPPAADAQMQAVLDQLGKLGGKPIESLDAAEARRQPTPADAVKALLTAQGKPTAPEAVGKVENRTFPGPGGAVPIRIYWPNGAKPGTALPVVLYIHGGGWVIADLDTYDASPRAVANAANAVVVSTHYRQGPEAMFPAAHEDTLAAYKWVLANAKSFGGDASKVALVGESAGGNMAANIAIAARDQKLQAPVAQVLVYPVAGDDMNTASYVENANAKPLNKPMMEWFAKNYLGDMAKASDPRIALVKQPNLGGLAPATFVLAQIDPLRSEGEMLAQKMQAAGTAVDVLKFDGVTHEFFGMGAVVDKAKQAQQQVGERLKSAFGSAASTTAPAAPTAASTPATATPAAPR